MCVVYVFVCVCVALDRKIKNQVSVNLEYD